MPIKIYVFFEENDPTGQIKKSPVKTQATKKTKQNKTKQNKTKQNKKKKTIMFFFKHILLMLKCVNLIALKITIKRILRQDHANVS